MTSSSPARIAIMVIICSLIIAGVISLVNHPDRDLSQNRSLSGADFKTDINQGPTSNLSYRIRVLWYDDPSRSYTFSDYNLSGPVTPDEWSQTSLPLPDNSSVQKTPGMIRFLSWNGNSEQMTGTRYLAAQSKINEILNQYTLISTRTLASPPEIRTPVIQTPAVIRTPAPGMITPVKGNTCNNGNGMVMATFGYLSREKNPVSVPIGDDNSFSPGEKDRGQPVTFSPGLHESVFSITYPENSTNIIWTLMGQRVEVQPVPLSRTTLTADPASGYAPLDITITRHQETRTPVSETEQITDTWDTGDGKEPVKIGTDTYSNRYDQPGTYSLTLTRQGPCGTTSSSATVHVYNADYSYEQGSPGEYSFTDRSTGDPTLWFWNFGDGVTSWEQNPNHTFPGPGRYQVGLKVSGSNGTKEIVHTITVSS